MTKVVAKGRRKRLDWQKRSKKSQAKGRICFECKDRKSTCRLVVCHKSCKGRSLYPPHSHIKCEECSSLIMSQPMNMNTMLNIFMFGTGGGR